ncbi:S8 family serine peptidase [Variovorax sp.]|uniref:S8 family serine peptidase n=1 Tax=Variovorax sp. TaxID=1871043 RepID=UPI003BAB89E8
MPDLGTTVIREKRYQLDSNGKPVLTSETLRSTVPDSDQTDKYYDFDARPIKSINTAPAGGGDKISTTSSYLPGTSQLDQIKVQRFDSKGVAVEAPRSNGTEVNIVSLNTVTLHGPSQTPPPDGTSLGPSAINNNLLSAGSYTAGINRSFWDVNTASGNQALISYAITDGLRPGNGNFGLNIQASSGLGLPILRTGAIGNTDSMAGSVDYGLFGSSLNKASRYNFELFPADPLVLDLNGDGVKLTSYGTSPVLFDADNDGGSLEQTGWVSAQDGIVVHDLNGDGKINNISETLSEYYNGVTGSNGVGGTKSYANGFAALKSLDSNADNQFTAKDAAWSKLRVWVDANHDGKTDAGELKTFEELGITAINLATAAQSGEVRDGNEVLARGTFTQNGIAREAIAANFLANPAGSSITQKGNGVTVVTENTAGGAGATTAYVSTNTKASIHETLDAAALKALNLTGGAGNDILTGDAGDNWLAGGTGADTLLGGAGDDLLLFDAGDKRIDGGDGFDVAQVVGAQGVSLNLTRSNIEMAIGGVGNDVFVADGHTSVVVRGGAGDDVIVGGAANDVLSGEDGDDIVDGGAGNDLIRGHRGRDKLLGGAGDDVLDGGLDDDDLDGGTGNDVLIGGGGDDNLNGGGGIDVAQYSGSYADYRITKLDNVNVSARYRVVDTRTGRDGADTLTGIEKLSFADVSHVDLTIGSPLPVKDVLTVNSTGQVLSRTAAHLLSKTQLLLNDRDWDSRIDQFRITEVLDANGGTVALTASGDVLFTPDLNYTGVMGFKYKVKDAEGYFTEVSNSTTGQTEPMKAAVYLQTGDLPSDPLAVEQWYLSDVNVMPVWKDYTGKGVRIGQFEPGGAFSAGPEVFDYRHRDLQPNVDKAWLNTLDANGRNDTPQTFSSHATMVAGVMVAARNGEGGVGVAYNATLAGHYIQGEGLEVGKLGQEITNALAKFKNFDVVNNSWGASTSFGLNVVPTGTVETGILEAISRGRNGLGTAIVMAGGNDRATGANTNYNALTANRAVIVAGSINAPGDLGTLQQGSKPFSNPGASILVSAPGSNIGSTSRELIGDNGSTFGSNYGTSQGTSFAAPIVSGVIALMLEANPALGYRDIQTILAMTATKVNDPNGTDWVTNGAKTWNGGGMHVSHDFGFGKVDARAAVRMAESWTEQSTYANEFVTSASSGALSAAIPDGTGMVTRTLAVGAGVEVESAQVTLDLDHQRWGDLIIKLISPGGTESVLVNRPDKAPGSAATDVGSASSGPLSFSFNTTHVRGEQSAGDWKLQVIDAATGNAGTLKSWKLDLYGKKTGADDVYVYTDEFGGKEQFIRGIRMPNLQIASMLVDSNGGTDTINASAVTSNSTINLLSGSTSTIAGRELKVVIGDIEVAIGGDGNDTLTGNGLNNVLMGGRGADVISGGGGNDTLDGGKGSDVLTGGEGSDLFVIGKDAGSQDEIVDFGVGDSAEAPEAIALVGFGNLNLASLVRTQVGADVRLDLGDGQSVLVRNRQVAQLGSAQLQFFASQAALQAWQKAGRKPAESVESKGVVLQDTALLIGGGGNNTLLGTDGNDRLVGSAGVDTLNGGAGDDVLVLDGDQGRVSYSTGRAGAGTRTGGAGADRFVVAPGGGGSRSMSFMGSDMGASNLIADFELAADKIDLSQFAWIKDFSQLKINKAMNINGKFITRVLAETPGQSLVSVGLFAIEPAALTAAHFIFAGSADATPLPLPVMKASGVTVPGAAPLGTVASAATAARLAQPLPIAGTSGNDVLTGDAGANTINGLEGADSMTGRTGDDTYIVDNVGDTVNELPGGGYDTVQSSVSYRVPDDVEVLVLTGTANIDATGNGQRNRLVGNAGDNRLDGGAEADDMAGGAGNDTYVVDDQLDAVHEDVNAGIDTVESSVSWTLGKNLESLTLTGTRNINATGNELANVLTGNAGDNILDGAQGADSMTGGAGNDTYYVDDVGDTVTEAVDGGFDTVYASVNTTLAANVEKGVLLGAATALTGNALDNTLIGNEQANWLNGGAGSDLLNGAGGDDTLDGGAGNDTYVMGRGYGVDRISENDATVGNRDTVLFDDTVDISQLWFRRAGNDLEVSLIGAGDRLVINSWYLGSQYHIEQFKSAGGKTLMDGQVQNLVQAMASFSPPVSGQTTLPANYQSNLAPVIAANWH